MVGTIFEASHVALNKWLAAFYLLCSSKKGMSAHQLHRMLGVTYKTAWFMFHRIHEAMKDPPSRRSSQARSRPTRPTRGESAATMGPAAGRRTRPPVMTLVERDGRARSFRMANVTAGDLGRVIRDNGLMAADSDPHPKRNGRLRIPLPFDDALKAATDVKPPEKPKRKPRQKKPAKS